MDGYWIYLVVAGVGLAGWLVREVRSRAAQSWPVVDGTVESTGVQVEGFGRDQREIAEVNYSYRVEGEFYSGAHEVSGESEFVWFPKLSRVVVHYKTSDPSKSFLDRQDVRLRREQMVVEENR
jgi:hypothetical protein